MVTAFQPLFFVRVPPPGSRTIDTDPPDGSPASFPIVRGGSLDLHHIPKSSAKFLHHSHSIDSVSSNAACASSSSHPTELRSSSTDLHQQLCRLGYLPGAEKEAQYRRVKLTRDYLVVENMFIERYQYFLPMFAKFARQICQSYLVNAATVLNNSHTRCLKMFILSAFDMARDMLITPKKLEFAREKEEELYKSLLAIAVSKINEIKDLISETIVDISLDVQQDAAEYDFSVYGKC